MTNSTRWLKMKWIDQYTGNSYRITTAGHNGTEADRTRERPMETYFVNTNFIPNRNAPMKMENYVKSKQSACCGVGTFASIKSNTLAKSRTNLKLSMLA